MGRGRRIALGLGVVLLGAVTAAVGQDGATRDATLRVPAGLDSIEPAACGACHAEHLHEWETSAHRTSFTNALFLAELRHRRLPSCIQCHAPRGEQAQGIDCAVCHVRDGAILNPTVSGRAPHASRVAPELGDERACAGCHEFDFDGQPGDRLQRTVSEWASSRHAGTTCQGCHLPPREGHRAHHFPGGLDEDLLRDAIAVRSARAVREDGLTRVELVLEADHAGHAVPTGDIFRRLEVRAWPAGRPREAASTMLARRFRVSRGRWEELADRRVPAAGTRRVELELEGEVERVEYTIDLWRAPPDRVAAEGWRDRDVRRRLAEGALGVDRAR
jgi:predicted CxxxxCH...CXXCH cytochrome family protein